MGVGQRHTFGDGYSYVETLHGPNVETACASCGDRVYATPEHVHDQLCSTCGRRRWGAPVIVGGARARRPTGVGFPSRLSDGTEVDRECVGTSAPRVALVEEWPADDPRLPVGCRKARDALWDRGRRVGVLHTVALLPTGELDERISVQSPGGVFLVWRRNGRGWTGSAILNAWRERPVKMTVTKAMQIINGWDRA